MGLCFLAFVVLGFMDNLILKPFVLGLEFAGIVLETGAEVSTVKEVSSKSRDPWVCSSEKCANSTRVANGSRRFLAFAGRHQREAEMEGKR